MNMGRKPTTSNDLPENLTFDPDRNRYRYRWPRHFQIFLPPWLHHPRR